MITKEEVKRILNSISRNSEYRRVSETHPLELYLGLNEAGNFTLRFNGPFSPIKIIGNDLLEIKQVKLNDYNSILFSFNSIDNVALFYHFCEDIINQTYDYSGCDGYAEIVNRYNQWKKLFYGSSSTLSEQEIMGLLGELHFLENHAIPLKGESEALKGWSGPEPTHKDFSYDSEWFEIKTINSHKSTVAISSLEQLDSDREGKLVVVSLEKMSPSFKGITLNDAVKRILDSLVFDTSKDVYMSKLKLAGYSYNEVYDNFVYNFIREDSYKVSDGFPRIRKVDLPNGVTKVTYEIELSQIEHFKENDHE